MSKSKDCRSKFHPEVIRQALEKLEVPSDPKLALERLFELKRANRAIADKGGLVVVVEDNTLITTYRYDSYDRHRHTAQ